jgi:hypothetical protein
MIPNVARLGPGLALGLTGLVGPGAGDRKDELGVGRTSAPVVAAMGGPVNGVADFSQAADDD